MNDGLRLLLATVGPWAGRSCAGSWHRPVRWAGLGHSCLPAISSSASSTPPSSHLRAAVTGCAAAPAASCWAPHSGRLPLCQCLWHRPAAQGSARAPLQILTWTAMSMLCSKTGNIILNRLELPKTDCTSSALEFQLWVPEIIDNMAFQLLITGMLCL
jgi:hypothetical protein